MMRQRAMRARRATAGGQTGREIPLPLPLRGIHSRAKSAQISGMFARELLNFRSNGVSLEIRPPVEYGDPNPFTTWRIPFQFGGQSRYIEVRPTRLTCGDVILFRRTGERPMHAALSSNVLIADGMGLPVRFNGTSFADCLFTVTTGADVAGFDGILAHQDRPFLWKRGGPLEFYYGEVGAVQGALQRFPLDRLGNITGSIAAMVSLTVDAGHGMNDTLCILTTTGQAVVYEGLNPGDSQDWRLLGRFQATPPADPMGFLQIGSDCWMISSLGIVSLRDSLSSSLLALTSDVARPLIQDITALLAEGDAEWQGYIAGNGSFVLLNRVKDGAARQFVYWVESGAWMTFDLPARCFHTLGTTTQFTALDGRLGTVGIGTEQITARWVSSWFSAGGDTSVVSIKPTIRANGPVTMTVAVLSDHNDTAADIAEATQTVILTPDRPGAGITEEIAIGQPGQSFQLRMEVTAPWMELVELQAMMG